MSIHSLGRHHRIAAVIAAAVIVCGIAYAASLERGADTPQASRYRSSSDTFEREAVRYADARSAGEHLTFPLRLPRDTGSRELLGVYVRPMQDRRKDGTPVALPAGKSNYAVLAYEDDIRIHEKDWDASVVPDSETSGRELIANFQRDPRMARLVHTARIGGLTMWYWERFTLPEELGPDGSVAAPGVSVESSQVSWFSDGVSFTIGSARASVDELLAIARSMILSESVTNGT